jgi:hypothetical protein
MLNCNNLLHNFNKKFMFFVFLCLTRVLFVNSGYHQPSNFKSYFSEFPSKNLYNIQFTPNLKIFEDKLVALKVCFQNDCYSCGNYAFQHAQAINDIFNKNGDPISFNELLPMVQALESTDKVCNQLSDEDIFKKIKDNNIDNIDVLTKQGDEIIYNNVINELTSSNNINIGNYDQLINQHIIHIRDTLKKKGVYHFIVNTGDHWVLLSYFKKDNVEPLLAIIDSSERSDNNYPMTDILEFYIYVISSIFA